MDLIASLGIAEVLLGFVTIALPAIVVAYFKYRSSKDKLYSETTRQHKEEALASSGKDFIGYLKAWNDIEADIQALLEDSPLDRFLILRGWNGVRDPELTTAIYQYKSNKTSYITYDHVELDDDYRSRLRRMYGGPQAFNVEELQPCLIKSIYNQEGVTSSVWFFLVSGEINGVAERNTTYCSFSSTEVDHIDEVTLLRAQLLTSKIKGVMHKFLE